METTESTEAPAPQQRRRPWLPRVFAVVVLLAAGVVALVQFDVVGGPSPEERDATVLEALAQRMKTELERMPTSEHAGHGGADTKGTNVCATRVYGYEPKDAKTAADVDTVYGFHFCAVAVPKGSWDFATKYVAPLVMKFDTTPPSTVMVAATETVGYRDRLKQVIPPEYQAVANEGALEPDAMKDLRRRYDAAVADA